MTRTILILGDGMADEPLAELDGQTPIEYAATPNMDAIARDGACGTMLTLPEPFPNSSDVANMSVLGYDLETNYRGRGAFEALSQGIPLAPDDVAWRCNLVTVREGILEDYSAGHIDNETARALMAALAEAFADDPAVDLYPGVSYRNLLITHGSEFTDRVSYAKPDASQGERVADLRLEAADDSYEARHTAAYLNALQDHAAKVLAAHPVNAHRESPGNTAWLWSPGRAPAMQPFVEKYGARGAIISAVDVIFGLGIAAGMTDIRVPGATGFIDTDYEAKADAALAALEDHDFVYVHVEAPDECGHLGRLDLKLQAIEDLDRRLIGRLVAGLGDRPATVAVLPDHPVPVRTRCHTREPVPVAIRGPHIAADGCARYSERVAPSGALGELHGDLLMRRILGLD